MRDGRRSRLEPRALGLLADELVGLERLYRQTADNSPDKVQLMRRLAEGYVELESAAERDNQTSTTVTAQDKAIAYYITLKDKYPSYQQRDEVLYYLAYEYERANERDLARVQYFELVQNAPTSPYVPRAYFAFGELFSNEARQEPSKWQLAAMSYQETVARASPGEPSVGFARYRLAQVHHGTGEHARALGELTQTLAWATEHVDTPGTSALVDAARRDLVLAFAQVGDPKMAFDFFRPLSGDSGDSVTRTVGMMLELVSDLVAGEHADDAASVMLELLSKVGKDRDARVCQQPPESISTALHAASNAAELERRQARVCR